MTGSERQKLERRSVELCSQIRLLESQKGSIDEALESSVSDFGEGLRLEVCGRIDAIELRFQKVVAALVDRVLALEGCFERPKRPIALEDTARRGDFPPIPGVGVVASPAVLDQKDVGLSGVSLDVDTAVSKATLLGDRAAASCA